MFRFRSTQPVLRMIVARRPAALACGGALAFGTAAAAAAAAAAPPPDASLGSLWAAALDGMIDVPGAEKCDLTAIKQTVDSTYLQKHLTTASDTRRRTTVCTAAQAPIAAGRAVPCLR